MTTFWLIIILIIAVLLSAVVDQLIPHVSIPLIQIAVGFIFALLAVSPIEISVDPEFFLVLFIAPLLFNDAKHADKLGLWKNRGTILSLAIGLVIAITLVVGFSLHLVIPSIPLAAAFALGAALGPTDAVAVSSLQSSAELGRREKSLLSGEALINDASGVVSFQFAVAAAVTGSFSIFDASLSFVIAFFGGILLGIGLAFAAHFVQTKVRDLGLESITFHVLFDISMPFLIFLVSEAIGVSGILAVVAAGLVVSSFSERRIGPSVARLNIVSSSVWRVLTFTLNGVVFVLLGMQLPRAMQSTWDSVAINNFALIGFVVLITVVIVAVRFLWILLFCKRPASDDGKRMQRFDGRNIKSALVATAGGPKGAITLSIVLSLPFFMNDGGAFPQRDLLIFIASGVILCTLLIANFALPLLAPGKPRATGEECADEARMCVTIMHRVVERLNGIRTPGNARTVDAVIDSYNQRISKIRDEGEIESPTMVALTVEVLDAQRDYLVELAETNEIDEVEGYRYIRRLAQARAVVIQHNGGGEKLPRRVKLSIRRYVLLLVRFVHALWRLVPGASELQNQTARRDVQIKSERYAIRYLAGLLDDPDSPYPADEIVRLRLSHISTLRLIESKRPDITAYTTTTNDMDDIERRAYAWELEEIQDSYDAGDISRGRARRMRDNVYLMQIDLENHV